MRVHRIVFRLDFQRPNFAIIDSPGTVMKTLSDMGEQYWPDFRDESANRRVSTSKVDAEKGTFREMAVEPTHLSVVFESAAGIDLNSVDADETLSTLFKGIHSLCETFKVNDIQRAGIRLSVLGQIKGGTPSLFPLFNKLFDQHLVGSVKESLGDIKDTGIAFDGEGADKLGYHCRFGPFDASEASKYFTATTAKKMTDETSANLIFDLDIFELKFAMTVSAAKWSKSPLAKAKQLTSSVEEYLTKIL